MRIIMRDMAMSQSSSKADAVLSRRIISDGSVLCSEGVIGILYSPNVSR